MTDSASTASPTHSEQQLCTTTGPARAASEAAGAAVTAAAPNPATGPTNPASPAHRASHPGPAGPAIATFAEQQPTSPAGPARAATDPPAAADAAAAPQPRRTAGPASLTRRPGGTVAAISNQEATIPTGPTWRGGVGAVTDNRTTKQSHSRRIDRPEQIRFGISRLGGQIGARAGIQDVHEVPMKICRLRANRLILLAVLGEQRGNCRRHLVGGRRCHYRRR